MFSSTHPSQSPQAPVTSIFTARTSPVLDPSWYFTPNFTPQRHSQSADNSWVSSNPSFGNWHTPNCDRQENESNSLLPLMFSYVSIGSRTLWRRPWERLSRDEEEAQPSLSAADWAGQSDDTLGLESGESQQCSEKREGRERERESYRFIIPPLGEKLENSTLLYAILYFFLSCEWLNLPVQHSLPPESISLCLQKFQPQTDKTYSREEYHHIGARCIFVLC